MKLLTLDTLRTATALSYSTEGIANGEQLFPVRWDEDGEEVWQVITADGRLAGFLGRANRGSVYRDRTYRQGTFEIVLATEMHLAILRDWLVPHSGSAVLLVDGARYVGEPDARYGVQLVEA